MQMQMEGEIAKLRAMSTGQLIERYAEVFGEPVRSRHRAYLIRKIAWRIQALAEGSLSERALRRAEELANDADVRVMPPRKHRMAAAATEGPSVRTSVATDPRLPTPGGAILRKYKGREILVIVRPDGFEYEGEAYKSLSAVAKAITGSHCSGFRFFNLGGNL